MSTRLTAGFVDAASVDINPVALAADLVGALITLLRVTYRRIFLSSSRMDFRYNQCVAL